MNVVEIMIRLVVIMEAAKDEQTLLGDGHSMATPWTRSIGGRYLFPLAGFQGEFP